jgi:hypothetical protein
MLANRASRTPFGRILELVILAAALLAFYGAGAWNKSSTEEQQLVPVNREPAAAPFDAYSAPTLTSPADSKAIADPRRPEQHAVEARAAAIQHDAAAIRAECQRAARGDWASWQRETATYRADLWSRVAAPGRSRFVLAAEDGFPLFEIDAKQQVSHLYDDERLDEFMQERPVVAARRWLGRLGIDLIFVPVPKMTSVYMEHFISPCPADGIIAPHLRRALLELLEDDVEVVDGMRLFRWLRDTDPEYLYNTADPHWAPRGMRIMAEEIASRIKRYRFGARARFALPIVQSSPGPYVFKDLSGHVGVFGW